MTRTKKRLSEPRKNGFALIVTLSLMILLTVIAVGLLSLSSITLRTTGQGNALATARANARMALMLAIGQLQSQSGIDTRITARADILKKENPMVLGAWESWQGKDHTLTGAFAGRPISPANYKTEKESRFLSWLTSSNVKDAATLPDTATGEGKVALLGTGSVGTGAASANSQIHLTPVPIATAHQKGSLAWWVGGENQKARLPKPYQPESASSVGKWAAQAKSHSIADPKTFRMESLLEDPAPADKAITLQEADLIAPLTAEKVSREFFHDLSAVSTGLLTNTATGGWRKDMSLLTENGNYDKQPASGLPMFRVEPGRDLLTSRATSGNPRATGSMLYPWAAYRGSASDDSIYQHGAVTSWANLMNFATYYKSVSGDSIKMRSVSYPIGGATFDFLHKVRVLPVIARIQWVFFHSAGPAAVPPAPAPAPPAGSLEPRVILTPVITMWNPYNVSITGTGGPLRFVVGSPIPVALQYTINGATYPQYNSVMEGATNYVGMGPGIMDYTIPAGVSLKPGETRVYSPKLTVPKPSGQNVELAADYRPGGGNYYPVRDSTGKAAAVPPTSVINKVDAKFDAVHNQGEVGGTPFLGVGINMDMLVNDSRHLAYRMIFEPAMAAVIYKPITGLSSGTLSQVMSVPKPFLSTLFGARMASNTHLAAKGFVQSSPLVNYTAMGRKDEREYTIKRHYRGTRHPVNSPFDYSFVSHSGGVDTKLPNTSTDGLARGRIVTGFTAADGLSRCIISELPTRPIASLGELVNWDLRYENPIPPFGINLIGNSDATPLIGKNAVVGNWSDAVNLQYDDSYCANHLLFDDWFFSSIAPDGTSLGASGRNQQTVFEDFVAGKVPLPNRAYQPIASDQGVASADGAAATKLYNDQVKPIASWKTIASRIEVEGMFNVNSTSVKAWRALLGHARNQEIPTYNSSGVPQLSSGPDDYAVTRFSVAGDGKAGTANSMGDFAEANALVGYRTLDERFLDALAAQVVEQVRQRGPFLSLSEFINRQLSDNEDLALAGAIQSALNELTKQGSANNIFADIQPPSFSTTRSLAVPERAGDAEYEFPKAAEGYSAYGLPGWTRQADILRPLAPVLSARDDTFTIRAYGDAKDPQGRILASGICEAVVRRTRDFVDPADRADITTLPVAAANRTFGRRFEIVSFRWLNSTEI